MPGAYNLEAQVFRGFWMVTWFKQEFGQIEQQLAHEQGVEVEALFDDAGRRGSARRGRVGPAAVLGARPALAWPRGARRDHGLQ